MASSSNDPTTGAPVFLDSDAPDPAVNPTEVAGFAADVGTRRIGTTAQRSAHAYDREGFGWYDTTLDADMVHDGSGYYVARARIRGRVARSATATTFPSSGYTNVAPNTFWTADVAQGIAAYDGGWTVPLTGRYMVSYEVSAGGAFLAGLTVNYSGASPLLFLKQTASPVQTIATTTVAGTLKLTAGDVVRLYLLADSGNPAWTAGVGFFAIEWVGAD